MSIYPNLNTNNTFGPYGGTLANGGERLVLAAADYDRGQQRRLRRMEKLNVPVSDVTYGDGGKWGNWSDGRGSSLELIDPEADVHHPSNWADSNDTGESLWTAIEMDCPARRIARHRQSTTASSSCCKAWANACWTKSRCAWITGRTWWSTAASSQGLNGWTLQGSHDFSTVENSGFAGSKSLHVRAGSRGDNQSNRILSPPFAQPDSRRRAGRGLDPRQGAVAARASGAAACACMAAPPKPMASMALPRRLGTPGAPNSRRVANAGPAIYDVKHAPLLPAADEAVVVTARATDRQGVASLTASLPRRPRRRPTRTSPCATTAPAATPSPATGSTARPSPAKPPGPWSLSMWKGATRSAPSAPFPSRCFPGRLRPLLAQRRGGAGVRGALGRSRRCPAISPPTTSG